MAERKVKIPGTNGKIYDGVEVPIKESLERWGEIILDDGTTIRAKLNISAVLRVEDEYDEQGQPIYSVSSVPTVVVVNAPDNLRKDKGKSVK